MNNQVKRSSLSITHKADSIHALIRRIDNLQ